MKNPYLPPTTVVDGRDFERFILGEPTVQQGPVIEVSFDRSIRMALGTWDQNTLSPDTTVSGTLYYHIEKYLKSFGVQFESVLLLCTSNTTADAISQTDAVVLVKTKDHRELVATIDVSYLGGFLEYRYLKMGDRDYLDFQTKMYHQKRNSKRGKRGFKNWPTARPENHFLLTLNDLFRRGLKRLGRLIAESIKDQYTKNMAQQSQK